MTYLQLQELFLMGAPQGGQGNPLPTFIFMGAIFLVMYFFMIRPQSQKAKKQKGFINDLKKGDKIVTIGGIHGRILRVNDDSFLVEVDQNTKLKIEKSVISMEFTENAIKTSSNTAKTNQEDTPAT